MRLSKAAKLWLGAGTLWVCIYPLLFFAVWLMMFFSIFGLASSNAQANGEMPFFMTPFFAIFPLHCLTMLVQVVLVVVYLIHVIKNVHASETVRVILGVGIFFMPFIAMPVYYYVYIWLSQPPEWALAPSGPPTAPTQQT